MRRSLTLSTPARALSLAFGLVLSMHTGGAMALGFGKVTGTTALGHPLNFSVVLRLDADDVIEPGCVSADVVIGDRPLPSDAVRARIVRVGSTGERRIRVTTTGAVDEPTLSVTVRAGCPARLTRSFVVFADPPQSLPRTGNLDSEFDDESTDRATSPTVMPTPAGSARNTTRPPRRAAADGTNPRVPPRAPATPARPTAADLPVADARPAPDTPAATPRRAAPETRRPAAAAPAPTGRPTLRLDPIEDEVYSVPDLRMATALSTAPAASGAASAPLDPEAAQRQRELQQLTSLEASLKQLRDENDKREKAVASLQTQVRSAEGGRYANPVVYALAALCALLSVGLLAMWWLRARDRAQAKWWAEMAADAAAAESPESGSGSLLSAPRPLPPLPGEDEDHGFDVVHHPGSDMPPAAPAEAPALRDEVYAVRNDVASEPAAAEPRRPMSAEELIDLEQQVEFFVVLGQDDAAIDLLMGHVRSTSGVSPLPYMKLLEIYARRDEHEPYERIRERFNRRFNAYAPEWGVNAEDGNDVAGYPEVLGRLQGIWQMPSMAMELLDTLLFRRDAGPTFDVPAYRELLFLYGIARDLAERDVPSSGVDLLLPFGDDEPPTRISPVVATLSAEDRAEERADDTLDIAQITLDLDVSTDQPPTLAVEERSAYDPAHGLDFQVDVDDDKPAKG